MERVFAYNPAWRRMDGARRAEIAHLIGIGAPRVKPGAEAGPILGDEAGRGEKPGDEMVAPQPESGMSQAGD